MPWRLATRHGSSSYPICMGLRTRRCLGKRVTSVFPRVVKALARTDTAHMRKPLTIAAISAALVVTPLALTAPAYAGSALPSLKQLKVSGSWTEATAAELGNPPGGMGSLCPMAQSCSVRMWVDLGGSAPSYAQVAAGRTSSKAAALALASQLRQADTAVGAQVGPFVWTKQSVTKGKLSKKRLKIWTGELTNGGSPIERVTIVVSGARIATFYTYGSSAARSTPKGAVAALAKVVTSKKKPPMLSGNPRGFIGALNDNFSAPG